MPAKRDSAILATPPIFARAHIGPDAASTIGAGINPFSPHSLPLHPTATVVGISNEVGMVDPYVPTWFDGKATVINCCPVAIIVVALLPFPIIAKEPIGSGDRLPVAIAPLGSGLWSGGIVVCKVVVETPLSTRIVVSPAKLRIPAIVQKGKGNIPPQSKLERVDFIVSASYVVVRHLKMTNSTTEAMVGVGKVFRIVNL